MSTFFGYLGERALTFIVQDHVLSNACTGAWIVFFLSFAVSFMMQSIIDFLARVQGIVKWATDTFQIAVFFAAVALTVYLNRWYFTQEGFYETFIEVKELPQTLHGGLPGESGY